MILKNNWNLYYSPNNVKLNNVTKLPYFNNVTIPTLFELELYRNNILGHPYYSCNNWEYQKYETYHQYYVCCFKKTSKTNFLKLNGVDTIADIFINGKLIGKTNNAFLEYTFKLENLQSNNELLIHIYPSVIEGLKHDFSDIRQCAKYNFESLYIRKPASSFGWDILPRTPLGGIYKEVELIDKLSLIEDFYINPKLIQKDKAILSFNINEVNDITFKVYGSCDNSAFSFSLKNTKEITINNPKLWTIRGYGKQNLYSIKIEAIKNNKVIESKTIKYGLRKVELKRSSIVQDNGQFEFYINDQKVFLLGSNWVPVEAIKHIDNKRAKKAIECLVDLNCNAIRIWGGGTYETEELYSLCDEQGIFIWQDFMMGCATYPQDKEFINKLEEEVTCIVKRLRNHCSICLWAGDNENDLASMSWAINKDDPNKNVLTRKVIPDILKVLDSSRPYLPSSPYIDEYAYSHKEAQVSEDHLWGPRDYFKGEYYKNAYPYFTSETGYHGLNSVKSLNKFIKKPWPLFDKKGNPTKEYMCHGVTVKDDMNSPYLYRTKLMYDQVKTLFSNEIDNLNDFVLASQISQAEAMKYFIEKMRRDTKRNGGIIWWNVLDGWPQISDAVIDYYFNKKLAYYFIKKSQQDLLLFIDENEDQEILYVSSLKNKDEILTYEVLDSYTDKIIKSGSLTAKARESRSFDTIANDKKHHFYIIKYRTKNGKEYLNTFHSNIIRIELNKYKEVLKKFNYFK